MSDTPSRAERTPTERAALAAWRVRTVLHLNLPELMKVEEPARRNIIDAVNDLNNSLPPGEEGWASLLSSQADPALGFSEAEIEALQKAALWIDGAYLIEHSRDLRGPLNTAQAKLQRSLEARE